MSSLPFEFLDFSEIEEEDLRQLVCILDNKKAEFGSLTSDQTLLEELKEVGEDFNNLEIDDAVEGKNFVPHLKKDANTCGISFFVDGGTAEDIDPRKPPPLLCSNESPPPVEELSITPEDEPEEDLSTMEDPVNIYPQHDPQPHYINQPPPMVQQINVHNVPTSGPIYNIPPPFIPHSTTGPVPNGMYSHIQHSHSHPPHLVHIENCHVNLGPYGNPPQPHTGLYATPSHYQVAAPHQVYQPPFMVADPIPVQMKSNLDKEYDHKRHETHNRGAANYRGRGRGRGTRRRGREDHERSNSVSSDHSSYSDSGSKPHFKEAVPPMPMPPSHYSHMIHYPAYIPYHFNISRPSHSYPVMHSHQFMPDPSYVSQTQPLMAYPSHPPPPGSVSLLHHENPNHIVPHSECEPVPLDSNQVHEQITLEQQVTAITTHTNYIVTTSPVNTTQIETCQYTYSNIDDSSYIVENGLENVIVPSDTDQSICLQIGQDISNMNMQIKDENIDSSMTSENEKSGVDVEIEFNAINRLNFNEEELTSDQNLTPKKYHSKIIENSTEINTLTTPTQIQLSESISVPNQDELPDRSVLDKPVQSFCNQYGEKVNKVLPNDNHSSKARDRATPKSQESIRKPHTPKVPPSNITKSSRDSSPVPNNWKSSPVPLVAQKSKENDVSIPKSKRKNSPHNKENAISSSLPPSSLKGTSAITFGSHNSFTVYNKSLTVTNTEIQSSKCPEVKPVSKLESIIVESSNKEVFHNSIDQNILAPLEEIKYSSKVLPEETKETTTTTKTEKKEVFMHQENKYAATVQEDKPSLFAPQEEKFPRIPNNDSAPSELYSHDDNSFSKDEPKTGCSQMSSVTNQKQSEAAWGQKKSWSQLFKPNEDFANKQVAFVSPFNAKEATESDSSKLASGNENGDISFTDSEAEKAKVGGVLKKYNQDYRPVILQPRGLINKNYWCYVNAPLQALLACPSLYQLAKTLSTDAGYASGNMATPFINSIVDFVSEFNVMSTPGKQSRKEKAASQKKDPEVVPGAPFEPTCVYKMLINCKKNQFTEGRQQDAEEMLSCVLNGLHDEMVESLKLAGGSAAVQNGFGNGDKSQSDCDLSEDENEWKVQGPKKKSCITRMAHFNPSPISQIFWGQLRSVLQQAGGSTTANLQPFNTLPLDIQSPKVDTLKDALSQLVTREEISGFTCPKTNQEVTASNQVMFEDLPRVLILQLKRFIYDKDGGLQKVTKRLGFPIDLEITKDLISVNNRGRFTVSQRKYKLFAIVNHEGKEATKGHYVADVFHNGYNCWIRYDDSNVKAISESIVLRHEPPRVPYLLFYRRSDTFTSLPSNSSGKSSK